jgi:hypothetical protein
VKKLLNRITNWEAWPFKILYTPMAVFWLWYILKSKAVWFFTPANPKLTFGGMEREPKKEMYDLLPKKLYPPTFTILPHEDLVAIQQKLLLHNISYPFIVKPEVGGQGILLRKINNEEELKHYHTLMPWEYIVQQLVVYPIEVSVFYIRHPKSTKGTITGFLHKIPLQVIGNGTDTLEDLIEQHPKGEKFITALYNTHKERWKQVIPDGESYQLSYAANHNRGAQFIDLKNEIDDRLVVFFDTISNSENEFYYGRYDIMCTSVQDLKDGKNFTILEYNGCGAEPNHFYDTGYTLLGAYKEILKHWKALYQISKYNKKLGIKPWPFSAGRKFLVESRKLTTAMKAVDIKIG